ncbi:MAG: 4-alpha-glucanotransferase [Candidatus Muproteobacteria bacterium RBG_16_64_11]|uniref:4-alpha-glucanotransferase n=1 Tax=Candidatus Muproteobacteria bacterium RBG_16_64_11 TaxID=1817758 RepID=A0A1F6TIP4_9PROT|nr:MAG: 4-alpha-glucanotransferase [Candidatus Muproteobacteria bacterium RBG_16_64_11]
MAPAVKAQNTILDKRRAGVLLHPTSLPAGDFGTDAYRFVEFLAAACLSVWQTLPLGPTHDDRSPYHCLSVHAIDPGFISFERLISQGWLKPDDIGRTRHEQLTRVQDWFQIHADPAARADWQGFAAAQGHWLEDYALFQALREEQHNAPWWRWPTALRDRDPEALAAAHRRLAGRIALLRFEQYLADRQWQEIKVHAGGRGVRLFGDMPIFIAHDSAEVWAHRDCFRLDAAGQPLVVAGVPPDYFSAHGQRWGNPLYDWECARTNGFQWWLARLATEFSRFDLVRVDHFRGFEACWEIPATDATAANGRWVEVPGAELFDTLLGHFGALPLVAEDLGHITPAVHALRARYGLPGMLVLQFAFDGGPDNPYLPHNHPVNSVVYTGTHDNDTTRAWFESLPAEHRLRVTDYLGQPQEAMPWPLVRAALASVARLAILPMQDILGLGPGQRINTPGTTHGNWQWRFNWDGISEPTVTKLRKLVSMYGRQVRGEGKE